MKSEAFSKPVNGVVNSRCFRGHFETWLPGGASREAWIRVYMIAPVKKFGRARLSTDFLINKHGGDFM